MKLTPLIPKAGSRNPYSMDTIVTSNGNQMELQHLQSHFLLHKSFP